MILLVLVPRLAVLLPSAGAKTTSEIVDTLMGLVLAVSVSMLIAKPPQALCMLPKPWVVESAVFL